MRRRGRQELWCVLALVLLALPPVARAERGRQARAARDEITKQAVAPGDPATKRGAPSRAPRGAAATPPSTVPDTEAAGGADADAGTAPSGPEIQTRGEEGMRAHFVDHAGAWSLHAENLPTDYLFRLWREVGGPQVVSRLPLDRTFTISVHAEPAERILERLLDGYGYTLHYDAGGRLELVRVYSPTPDAGAFKTPRLVESLSSWRDVELEPQASAAQSN